MEFVVRHCQRRTLARLVIDHKHLVRAPVPVEVFSKAFGRLGLRQGMLAVVVLDLPHAVLVLVEPCDLFRITRVLLIYGVILDHETFPALVNLIAHPFVPVLLHLLARYVLIGKLAAHKRAGLVAGAYAFSPFKRGKEEPLVVVIRFMCKVQERGALDVPRCIEDRQALVAVVLGLQRSDPDFALALLAALVPQDHLYVGPAVTETGVTFVGLTGYGKAFVFGGLCCCYLRRQQQNQNHFQDES